MTDSHLSPEDAFDRWLDDLADGSRPTPANEDQEAAKELHRLFSVAPTTSPHLGKQRKAAIRQQVLPQPASTPAPLRPSRSTGIIASAPPLASSPSWLSARRAISLVSAAMLMLIALASIGVVLRLDDDRELSSVSATASMMPFAPASALASQTPAPQDLGIPLDSYRPQIVDSVPVPGTDANEVLVIERAPEDTYGPPPQGCSPTEVATIMVRFFTAWSAGDQETMERYLAPSPSPAGTPIPDWERPMHGYLAWFGINPIPGGIADGSGAGGYTTQEVLDAAADRHEQNEVIQVLQIEYGSTWHDNGIGMTFDLARDADDIPPHIIGGKGGIDCETGRITVVSASDQSPVVPEEWFEGVEPIVVPNQD